MRLQAPRKREREHDALAAKVSRALERLDGPNVPQAQLVLAVRELAAAVEELRALVARGR